jgi:hypothetical protein
MSDRVILLLAIAGCGENLTHPNYSLPKTESCFPNLDGRIEAEEFDPSGVVQVPTLVSPRGEERPVDQGRVDSYGRLVWDLSVDFDSDELASVSVLSIEERWYRDAFPADAILFSGAGAALETIYRWDGEVFWILGAASRESDPAEGRTVYAYREPVALHRFPLAPKGPRTEIGVVDSGTFFGAPYAGRDLYTVEADDMGQLVLPEVTFTHALRVSTHLAIEPSGGGRFTRRFVSFMFECFGEVARLTSRPEEMNDEFEVASEMRRFTLRRD